MVLNTDDLDMRERFGEGIGILCRFVDHIDCRAVFEVPRVAFRPNENLRMDFRLSPSDV